MAGADSDDEPIYRSVSSHDACVNTRNMMMAPPPSRQPSGSGSPSSVSPSMPGLMARSGFPHSAFVSHASSREVGTEEGVIDELVDCLADEWARIKLGNPAYDDVRRLAFEVAGMGCRIITGGGPGLMQAANEGAYQADPANKAGSIGIRVDLPFEQNANDFVGLGYDHKTFFSRLHHFMLVSDVFVCVPGGIGTLLEASMVWQLLQVRKLHNTPLILVGPMWSELIDWARKHMVEVEYPLASAIDMTIPCCVPTVDDAIAFIRAQHSSWQGGA